MHDIESIGPDKTINWQIFQTIWPYLSAYKQRIGLALLLLVAAKLATIVVPFLLKYIVDYLDSPPDNSHQLMAIPLALILCYGLARFSNVLFAELRDTIFGRVTEQAMHRIGLQVFEHLHQLDLSFHLDRQTGGLSRDIERGITGISFLMRFFVFNIFPTILEIALVISILWLNYSPAFSLITLIAVTVYVIFSIFTTEWRTQFMREANAADNASNTRAIDSLLNYETVKYFNNEAFEASRYDQELTRWESARRKNRLSLFTLNGGQALIIATAQTLMIGLAAKHVIDGSMTLGDFTLINAFMMQLFLPLNFLGFLYREIKSSMANIERLFLLLGKKSKIVNQPNAQALSLTKVDIEFKDVHFSYQSERPILKGVSFRIANGEKVAVVGPSGSGKSTLIKLLFRFYDTSSGCILVDGHDIRDITLQSLRQHIGIIPQDTVLFNDSIVENIRYGRPEASDLEIDNVINLSSLKNFINSLPKGGDTIVGERGLKLSGGEKQRIAIARTLLKSPPILAFDEATSSLDSQSEQKILKSLQQLIKGHTSLVVAHRLSTIVDADKILVLYQGEIIEQGNHQQLLDQKGYYSELWQVQQREQQQNR